MTPCSLDRQLIAIYSFLFSFIILFSASFSKTYTNTQPPYRVDYSSQSFFFQDYIAMAINDHSSFRWRSPQTYAIAWASQILLFHRSRSYSSFSSFLLALVLRAISISAVLYSSNCWQRGQFNTYPSFSAPVGTLSPYFILHCLGCVIHCPEGNRLFYFWSHPLAVFCDEIRSQLT